MTDALIPIEQREVDFLGDPITVVIMADAERTVFVPLRPIIQSLGIDWSSQLKRVRRDKVLSDESRFVVVSATNPLLGGDPEAVALPLKYVPGFLFGISLGRIKGEEKRKRVEKYQRDCHQVLNEAVQEGRLGFGDDPDFEQALATADPASVSAYHQAQAVVRLARNQILIQAQLHNHGQRLDAIEATLGPSDHAVTGEQASQLSQAVKAVAIVLTKQSGSNQFGGVYGELYRKFGITSYKLLPAARFQEAMDYLTNWHQSLVGEEPF